MRERGVATAARRRRDAAAAIERGDGAFGGFAARATEDDARRRSRPRRAQTRGRVNRCRVPEAESREVFHATAGEGRRAPTPPRTEDAAARTEGGWPCAFVGHVVRLRRVPRVAPPPASPSRTRDRASAPGRPSPRRKTRTADAPGGRREHPRPLRRRAVSAPGEGKVGCARTMLLDRVKPLRCGSKEGLGVAVSGLLLRPGELEKKPLDSRHNLVSKTRRRKRARAFRFDFASDEATSDEARPIDRCRV